MALIILLGVCFTIGLATQVLGNKLGPWGALRASMVGLTGAAITVSLCLSHTANILAESNPAHAELLLLSGYFLAGGAALGIVVVLVVGIKLIGRDMVFRKGFQRQSAGVALATLGMCGIFFTTLPKCWDVGTAPKWMTDASPYVGLTSLILIWCGLAFFAYGFLTHEKYRADVGPIIATTLTLVAGAGFVCGGGIHLFGSNEQIGMEVMQYSGLAFAGLLASMCIFFTWKFCLNGEKGWLEGGADVA